MKQEEPVEFLQYATEEQLKFQKSNGSALLETELSSLSPSFSQSLNATSNPAAANLNSNSRPVLAHSTLKSENGSAFTSDSQSTMNDDFTDVQSTASNSNSSPSHSQVTADTKEHKQGSPNVKKQTPSSTRKPKLKYRPRGTDVLDLNNIDISNETLILQQLQDSNPGNVDALLNNLYFLNYALASSRKIVCVSGAGTSVAAGIPDFRSSNGLFQGGLEISKNKNKNENKKAASLAKSKTEKAIGEEDEIDEGTERRYPRRTKPAPQTASSKQLFTSSVYSDSSLTASFHQLIVNLYNLVSSATPTKFHHLLNNISKEGRLLRLYTQNIDCLDTELPYLGTVTPLKKCIQKKATKKQQRQKQEASVNDDNKPVEFPRTIQLHGSLKTMGCSKCYWMTNTNPSVFQQSKPMECPECQELNSVRSIVGKRTQVSGIIRPRFVLYNEFHPDGESIGQITEFDLRKSKPDCLVIVGTSLKIPGVRRLVKEMSKAIKLGNGANLTKKKASDEESSSSGNGSSSSPFSNKFGGNGCVIWINLEKPSSADLNFMKELDLVVVGDCQKVPTLLEKIDAEKVFEDLKIKKRIGIIRKEQTLPSHAADRESANANTDDVNGLKKARSNSAANKISKPRKVQSKIFHNKGKLISFVNNREIMLASTSASTPVSAAGDGASVKIKNSKKMGNVKKIDIVPGALVGEGTTRRNNNQEENS